MFERLIAQSIQRIASEVLRDRQSVPLTEILEDDRIPTRFKPFFATEVRWWLYNDVIARGANKRFDFGHPELAALLDYLEQVMFRHARFEHDEFRSTLDGAVKLTFNYLCRPQTTLKWYIFRGQPVKPLSEVMLRFESFLDYEYIGNVFAEWVERKVRERSTFEAISAVEFERIIRRIDDQILLSCTVDELLALLDPIFDFIGEGDEQNVPVDALIIFFDDKNITRLVELLERYRAPNALISRERFVGILDELLTSAEENPEADFSSVYQNDELDDIVRHHLETDGNRSLAAAAVEAPTRVAERDEEPAPIVDAVASTNVTTSAAETAEAQVPIVDAVASTNVTTSAAETAEEQVPIVDAVASTNATTNAAETGEESTPIVDAVAGADATTHANESGVARASIVDAVDDTDALTNAADTGDEPASIVDAVADTEAISHADESSETPAHATTTGHVHEVIDDHLVPASEPPSALDPMLERKVFKKIFDRDRSAFDETLQKLHACETWRQASTILDEVFIRYDVDPYSRTALRFTDDIYSRYVKKNHN